jgi:hypothetical protein
MPIIAFGIKGTVTRNSVAVQGAKIWAENMDHPKTGMEPYKDRFTYIRTDSNGRYVLDAVNISSSSLADGDTIRVHCQAGDDKTFADVTVDRDSAGTTQNFTFSNSLIDGVRNTPIADGTGSLKHNGTRRGCTDGLS